MKPMPLEQDNHNGGKEERFETDAQRIVRRHLENQNDVITDEDLRSVRIGVDPDDSFQLADEEMEKAQEMVQNPEQKQNILRKSKAPNDDPTNSWDAIQ